MLVAVEESVAVAHAAEEVDFTHCDGLQCQAVEGVDKPGGCVGAEVVDIQLVEEQGNSGVDDHVAMEAPFRGMGHWVSLLVNGHLFVEIQVVHVEEVKEPVASIPVFSVPSAPCGLHRVLRVA